jgi:Cdc25 family phosphatase
MEKLVDTVQDTELVVFHCYYSQTRGPKAARMYVAHMKNRPHPPVSILMGGFRTFRTMYQNDPSVYESLH